MKRLKPGIVPTEQLNESDRRAIWYDAAVNAVFDDTYRNERSFSQTWSMSRLGAGIPTHPTSFYARLDQLMRREDFHGIEDYLLRCHEEAPDVFKSRRGAHVPSEESRLREEFYLDEVARGRISNCFKPDEGVERWITTFSDQICNVLTGYVENNKQSGKRIYRMLLGTSLVLHNIMAGTTVNFRTSQNQEIAESSRVASVIAEIREATFFTVINKILTHLHDLPEQAMDEYVKEHDRFTSLQIKAYQVCFHERGFQEYISRLKKDQELMQSVAEVLHNHGFLPLLAKRLEDDLSLQKRLADAPSNRAPLPFGHITIARPFESSTKGWLYYTAMGPQLATQIALTNSDKNGANDEEQIPLLPFTDERYTLQSVTSCYVDEAGKPYTDFRIDRYAPPLTDEDYRKSVASLGQFDRVLSTDILQEWNDRPALFAHGEISQLGPYIVIHAPSGKYLVCRENASEEIARLICSEKQTDTMTASILVEARVAVTGKWTSFLLEKHIDKVAEHPKTREEWRRHIRVSSYMKDRIPSLRWVLEHLQPFGVSLTTQGKGSHGSIVLTRNGGTQRQGTWRSLRSTESIPWGLFWDFLEHLGISEQEFCEVMEKHES